jgi:hemoglobin
MKPTSLILTAFLASVGFAQMGAGKKEMANDTLFERLGGIHKIAAFVADAVEMEADDEVLMQNPRFKALFNPASRPALRFLVTESIAAETGGMQTKPTPSLPQVQAWLALSQEESDRAWTLRMKAMDRAGVPMAVQMELRSWLEKATKTAKPMAPPMMEQFAKKDSLYARLGGVGAISAVVEEFVKQLAMDPVVTGNQRVVAALASGRVTAEGISVLLIEQLAEAAGGPFKYTGRSMLASHQGLMISEKEWEATAAILKRVLDEFKVPAKEQGEVFAVIASTKGDIVGR